ncbi:MAG: DUF3783 domain-containing protein [Thermodesulfobacteriota bacterium]|nr:DUF3783 domain-containing protein [Thermodesulfobacteriota bacterium]
MSQGTFKKVGESDQPLYGPRAMLVCGFGPEGQKQIMAFVAGLMLTDISVIFSKKDDGQALMGELFARPDQSGRDAAAGPDRAIILAGVTEAELQHILPAYRQSGLPRPLWATLTPVSETWSLNALIAELKAERQAMENRQS